MRRLKVTPVSQPLRGHNRPPGDKSISQRAAILGGLASGQTEITGFLDGDDARATLGAMAALGARVEHQGEEVRIQGGALRVPDKALDLGNSGTGLRLLAGALAGLPALHGARVELVGDASLSARPMGRIIEPLIRMGARIESREGRAPLILHPGPLHGVEHELNIASAQVKSCLLLAGMHARGHTVVREPGHSRDHTERMLPAFGIPVEVSGLVSAIQGGGQLAGTRVEVPGDPSSAAFVLTAAALVPGSELELERVGLNPTRTGFFELLREMGCDLQILERSQAGGEPVGRLRLAAGPLRGIEVAPEQVPAAIDEFPLLMVLAALAQGRTVIRGAAELRVKECDRIAVMCQQLTALGVQVEELEDGAIVHGGTVQGGVVQAHDDHRIAMSFAVLGLAARAPIVIEGAEWITTSYPRFVEDLRALGARLDWL